MFHFYNPGNVRKAKLFLTFSGGTEMELWREMGQSTPSIRCFIGIALKSTNHLVCITESAIRIFTWKHLCWSLFLKRDSSSCFPVNITKYLRAPILENICERLFRIWQPLHLRKAVYRDVYRTLSFIYGGAFCEVPLSII